MRKLKLRLEALKVESFEAVADAAPRGTVHARGYPYTDPEIGSCGCATPARTAPETCANSCYIQETCEPGVCW
jgi:hypothetical protein